MLRGVCALILVVQPDVCDPLGAAPHWTSRVRRALVNGSERVRLRRIEVVKEDRFARDWLDR